MDLKFGLPAPRNIYSRGTWSLALHFKGIFAVFHDFITAHAQKHHYSTSGFKTDLKFGFLVPKNMYAREIRP